MFHISQPIVHNLQNLLPTNVHKVLLISPRVHMDAFDEGGTRCMSLLCCATFRDLPTRLLQSWYGLLTLCNPDQSDRPCYFLSSYLIQQCLYYHMQYALYYYTLFYLCCYLCYLYDAVLILTLGYPLFTNTYVSQYSHVYKQPCTHSRTLSST